VYTAKEMATLDQLSGGRVILDAGAGWMKEEFDVFGVPFERRGERMDEYIKALACCGATRSRRSKMSSSTSPTFG
jgi:alkanesulfonate monooxygenase SsuD/methylene tetrahydromethanopterin reductase-like flavin-dependent oxidoreductase (luciferase family)